MIPLPLCHLHVLLLRELASLEAASGKQCSHSGVGWRHDLTPFSEDARL